MEKMKAVSSFHNGVLRRVNTPVFRSFSQRQWVRRKLLHFERWSAWLPRAAVINRRDVLHSRDGGQAVEPRHARHVRHKAGELRMPHQERIDGFVNEPADSALGLMSCCNFVNARGFCCEKPRANHFPNSGGGGPSLSDSLRSSSFSSCSAFIRSRMRLDSS